MYMYIEKNEITQGYRLSHNLGYHDSLKLEIPLEQDGESLTIELELDGIWYQGVLSPKLHQDDAPIVGKDGSC